MIPIKLDPANMDTVVAKEDLKLSKPTTYKMYVQGYQKKCYHHWRPDDMRYSIDGFKGFNSGAFIHGDTGVGKS
jgi:hypothetical protein